MARTPYADHDLRTGRLVAPFAEQIATGWNYYLVWPERKAKIDSLVRFVAWVREYCNSARSSTLVGAR
jgi:DNA-binding transcriptional LysR family regulator